MDIVIPVISASVPNSYSTKVTMSAEVKVKQEPTPSSEAQSRILSLCRQFPSGVSDKTLRSSMSDVDNADRANAINKLLHAGKIDLFKSAEKGLLYRIRGGNAGASGGGTSSNGGGEDKAGKDKSGPPKSIRGDAEEKLVYRIVQEAGNKGTWIRDIRIKSNLVQTQLNKVMKNLSHSFSMQDEMKFMKYFSSRLSLKLSLSFQVLKSLKSKKLIKDVKSVNSTRKIVYMLYELEPDRTVTGGAWYSDQDFESEFVDILNQQCHRFLVTRADKAKSDSVRLGPVALRNKSAASSAEVLAFISELGISKVQLKPEDIETILDTLVFDGKAERSVAEEKRFYRAVDPLLPATGLMRTPCGGCPVIRDCGSVGAVRPEKCTYIREWMAQ